MRIILNWLINATALYVATRVVSGVAVQSTETLLVAAFVIGFVNAIVRPIVAFLTFPITVLTLGLFYFVVNGLMLYLAASLTPGFELAGLGSAVFGAIIMSIVAMALHLFFKPRTNSKKRRA